MRGAGKQFINSLDYPDLHAMKNRQQLEWYCRRGYLQQVFGGLVVHEYEPAAAKVIQARPEYFPVLSGCALGIVQPAGPEGMGTRRQAKITDQAGQQLASFHYALVLVAAFGLQQIMAQS